MARILFLMAVELFLGFGSSVAWAEEGGKASLPQLDPSYYAGQLFWLFVTFPSLYLVVRYIITPTVQAVQTRRAALIEADCVMAKEEGLRAQRMKEEADAARIVAEREAQAMLVKIVDEATEESSKRQDAQRSLLDKQIKESENAIEAAKKRAVGDLQTSVDEIAGFVIERLVGSRALYKGGK